MTLACGSSSNNSSGGGGGNPAPSITSLNPTSVGAGGAGFTLTVNGTGFISTSAVEWNGSARTTTYVSGTQLQAQINAADIATGGTATVTVSNPSPGGGISVGVKITINSNAGLTITSLSPSSALAGDQVPTLTVYGTGFVSVSQVQWNYIGRSTTFVSSTELQAALYGDDTSNVAQIAVTVMNPGGGNVTCGDIHYYRPGSYHYFNRTYLGAGGKLWVYFECEWNELRFILRCAMERSATRNNLLRRYSVDGGRPRLRPRNSGNGRDYGCEPFPWRRNVCSRDL